MSDASNSTNQFSPSNAHSTGTRPNRRLIALTGFMGCGKSTVARLLARQIGWLHIDLDKRIVERTNLSIPAIFTNLGEPTFREIEHEELTRILGEAKESGRPTIVSLGGGTLVQPQNLEVLHQSGCATVWLNCPVEELLRRCSHITDRPLFRDEASFRELYTQRLQFYQKAEYSVESAVEPLRVVQNIIALGILEGVPA
ncbi:MAG TPA: shikimate kinase [Candidatus Acidoferrales bacterium]|nr:shikimate kinase [Candidatus Acidoferrales bacterium]